MYKKFTHTVQYLESKRQLKLGHYRRAVLTRNSGDTLTQGHVD